MKQRKINNRRDQQEFKKSVNQRIRTWKLSSKRRTKEKEWKNGSVSDEKKQPSKYWRLIRKREEEGGGTLI